MTVYRRAWTMQLNEGSEAAYDAAHADVWPELRQQMLAGGLRTFFLFRSERTVFAVQERTGPFPSAGAPPSEVTARWWREMARLMVTDATGQPVRTELTEVFSLTDAVVEREAHA